MALGESQAACDVVQLHDANVCLALHRPYVKLDKYDIPEEREELEWKLKTSKEGGCNGEHCTATGSLGTYE